MKYMPIHKFITTITVLLITACVITAQDQTDREVRLNSIKQKYDSTNYIFQSTISPLDWHHRYDDEENLLLKEILSHIGYEIDTDTSIWSENGIEIIKKFQRDNFIKVDGKIGPETLSTMSFILHELYKHAGSESFQETSQPSFGDLAFSNYDHIRVGDIVKYWHYDFEKWLYARVTKITGTTVELHDWIRDESFYMDMENIEGY